MCRFGGTLDGTLWRGVWRGPTTPSLGLYQVELEVPDPLRWTDRHVGTGTTPDGNLVRGVVEAAESDGVLTLRVNGGLVLVEMPEPLPAVGKPCAWKTSHWPSSPAEAGPPVCVPFPGVGRRYPGAGAGRLGPRATSAPISRVTILTSAELLDAEGLEG